MTRMSQRDFLKLMGAGAFVLTFGRFFQYARSLPNINSTSKGEIRARNNGAGFLFDIHGSVVFPDDQADVYLGTDNGSTINHLLQVDPNAMWGSFSLNHYLTSAGFVVSPKLPGEKENRHVNGGYTVHTYGSSSAGGIDAIQMELAPSIRDGIERRQVFVQTLANAIGSIVNHYA